MGRMHGVCVLFACGLVTALSASLTITASNDLLILSKELGRIWEEAVVT